MIILNIGGPFSFKSDSKKLIYKLLIDMLFLLLKINF